MTSDLRKLIEAVEAGETLTMASVIRSPVVKWSSVVLAAFDGSVDAAIALCEALLPGWQWGRLRGRMFVERDGTAFGARAPNPARALLLAVLRARLLEVENE